MVLWKMSSLEKRKRILQVFFYKNIIEMLLIVRRSRKPLWGNNYFSVSKIEKICSIVLFAYFIQYGVKKAKEKKKYIVFQSTRLTGTFLCIVY